MIQNIILWNKLNKKDTYSKKCNVNNMLKGHLVLVIDIAMTVKKLYVVQQ